MSEKLRAVINERERKRYALAFRELAKNSAEMAAALDANEGDDHKIIAGLLFFGMTLGQIHELRDIVVEAMKANAKDVEFPNNIPG